MAVYLRPATIEDGEDILAWRNDPTTRENSFSKEEISLLSHMTWLEKKLANPNCHIYILMDGDKKAGNIRVDVTEDVGEISYMIAPASRGKGFGKKILALAEQEIRGADSKVQALTGMVLKTNRASCRCFLANGYTSEDADDSYCFSKNIG